MPRLLADKNVEGQLDAIVRFLKAESWLEFWQQASIVIVTFGEVGLDRNAADRVVWQTCQSRQLVLFTGNRNQEGFDSLEETIRRLNRADSLPVITLGNPIRFKYDRDYAEAAAVKLLDYLLHLDDHRGAGRLYVP